VSQDALSEVVAETHAGWRKFKQHAPQAYAQLLALSNASLSQGLEPLLVEFVNVLCSYANGCTFCIQMHTKAALELGATHAQFSQLGLWPRCTADVFDARQNAAFTWSQALTQLQPNTPWPALRAATLGQFSAQEVAHLSVAVTTINAWNRLAIAHQFT
jgi:AhpD family alkylhydroperoxidase